MDNTLANSTVSSTKDPVAEKDDNIPSKHKSALKKASHIAILCISDKGEDTVESSFAFLIFNKLFYEQLLLFIIIAVSEKGIRNFFDVLAI